MEERQQINALNKQIRNTSCVLVLGPILFLPGLCQSGMGFNFIYIVNSVHT